MRRIEDDDAVTVDRWSGPRGTVFDDTGGSGKVRVVRLRTLPRRRSRGLRPDSARATRVARAVRFGSAPPDGPASRVNLVRATPKRRRVRLTKRPAQQRGRWQAFAPPPVRRPGRVGRLIRAVGRGIGHEYTLASLGSMLLAVVMTWPTLRAPTRTIPQDTGDPLLQTWQLAWSGHAVRTAPAELWESNTFYPEQLSYAFSDTLLGYAPFGLVGAGLPAAVLRYNIVFTLAFALALLGGYALARQLGAGRTGALVAGAIFAYAPWRWGQAGHLHILSSGGIPLALAMLARGHGFTLRSGFRPALFRPGWVIAGWVTASWQISLGFGIGLPFAYVLALIVGVVAVVWAVAGFPTAADRRAGRTWRSTRVRLPRLLLLADGVGGLLFAAVGAAMAHPYLRVVAEHPNARRGLGELQLYSPAAHGFLTAPAESWLWGYEHSGLRATLSWPGEAALLIGFVAIGLVLVGLVFSVWPYQVRFGLLVALVFSVVMAMGTAAPFDGRFTYLVLFRLLPGWDGIRTPGRLVLWTTLIAALLAAGALTAFAERVREYTAERVPARPGPLLRFALLLPVLLVLTEGVSANAHPEVPPVPAAMRQAPAPILVLPSNQLDDQTVMAWSVDGFPAIVNGGSGFTPRSLHEVRKVSEGFPDAASLRLLRDLGVKSVVVVKSRVVGTPYAAAVDADVDGLDVERQDLGEAVLYLL